MITINKYSSKLKDWSVEMPNTPYSNRYSALKKSTQLGIENEYI